ncbi:hypothetical protein [Pseudomonas extremaustralis]|uniref:hypothetical protein n=1 Tax=Pseudomonas extremaustralis TaxID=359110 RepID=UPI00285DC50E|nr:hypothetical protein [Pseudomonas extremaustralis]MDR6580008.1 hypothetical protein [Pseudomonas extremaustralis]
MRRIVLVGFLSLLSVPSLVLGYSQQAANEDAKFIWVSGCTDFKAGMNAGDFRGWLRVGEAVKTFKGIKGIAVNNLYMNGREAARKLGGTINCEEMAEVRAADYVSGVDIRKAE